MSSSASSGIAMSKSSPKVAASKKAAATAVTKEKVAAAAPGKDKPSSKTHRRSRSGCFTCRLRRKKCEEGKPACKACRHLGLKCDYKRPMWWSNGEQRRAQKEMIKDVIKHTQLTKKTTQQQQQTQHMHNHQHQHPALTHINTPPSLCHSVQTNAEGFSDSIPHSRAHSVGSPFSNGCDFSYQSPDGYFTMPPPPPHHAMVGHGSYPMFSPYEVDIKTERQIFINDVPTRKDSTISTFSTFQAPPMPDGSGWPAESWVQQDYYESRHESFANEEPVDFNFFEFPSGPLTPNHESMISVDDCDEYLLKHFLEKVLKLIFPVLDANQHGSARTDVILPALESNKAYLHCCLSVAATHMKTTEQVPSEQIDNDIVRHRYAAVSELCEQLSQDTMHSRILEATLGMIFFQCSVGKPDDALPDIAWHQHFQAAIELVGKLDLPKAVLDMAASGEGRPPFNMALTSWIDILGSTMLGRAPTFSDFYRELNLRGAGAGLAELMGCDDKIMLLISEIACLDLQRSEGMEEILLCKYVEVLAREIGATEPDPSVARVQSCFSSTGAMNSRQLSINISAVFRVAARIYLCTLVPGYEPRQPSMCHLISQMSDLMNFIPAGSEGFDRSLVWPLLVAGSSAVAGSPFRAMFAERCERLGEGAELGSFGRINELLKFIWEHNDAATEQGDHQGLHFREAMQQKKWDFLLI